MASTTRGQTAAVRIQKGPLVARLAQTPDDLARALALRTEVFRTSRGVAGADGDPFDSLCLHVLIESEGDLVCCYRLLPLIGGADLPQSYSAQFYDLTRLAAFPGAMLELGRFCLHPDHHAPDILRLAWGAMARVVDDLDVKLLFGCSSFEGANPAAHEAALAVLRDGHLAPDCWRPLARPDAYPFADATAVPSDLRAGMRAMPPLLRTYLAMGGWVSDHAVIDANLDTLHVFTAVEIDRIPAVRARALRLIAQ